jgi:general secretion pathway protein G
MTGQISILSTVVLAILSWGCSPPWITLRVREQSLKENLTTFRKMIDQYAVDQRALPASLDDLARMQYLREVPPDPITGKRDWGLQIGGTSIEGKPLHGVIDIHSSARGTGSDGIPYRDY